MQAGEQVTGTSSPNSRTNFERIAVRQRGRRPSQFRHRAVYPAFEAHRQLPAVFRIDTTAKIRPGGASATMMNNVSCLALDNRRWRPKVAQPPHWKHRHGSQQPVSTATRLERTFRHRGDRRLNKTVSASENRWA